MNRLGSPASGQLSRSCACATDAETKAEPPAASFCGQADAWWNPWRFGLLLALLIFAAFPDVLLGYKTFGFRDYALFGYPLAHYHRECFWNGEIPLWNPLNNCGLPFLAQWNTMVLYPLTGVYLLLPLPGSLGLFCLLHLFLAGLGMYFLALRWTDHAFGATVAGVAFAFNGLTLSCLIWPNNIAALAWVPWVLLLTHRAWEKGGRSLVSAALVGALQMLAGGPEIILFTWLLLVGVWLVQWAQGRTPRWRTVGRALALALLVSGLSAVQLLPFLDLLRHSQRSSNFGGVLWPMPPWGWANFLVPLFRCVETSAGVFLQKEQGWVSSYYLGIGVFGLAMLAIWQVREARVWLLGAALLLSLVLALGDTGYLFNWLQNCLPLGFLRYPVKLVVVAACVAPLLAAFAVRRFDEARGGDRRRLWQATGLVATTLLVLAAAVVWFAYLNPGEEEQWGVTWRSGLTRGGLLVLTLAMLWKLTTLSGWKTRLGLQVGFVLVVWLDVMTHAPGQNPRLQPEAYSLGLPPLLEMSPRPSHGQSRAMLSVKAIEKLHSSIVSNMFDSVLGYRLGLYDNCNLLDGLSKVDGFYSLYFPEETQVRFRLFASVNASQAPLADFLGVSQLESQAFVWTPRASSMPLMTAGQEARFSDGQQTIELMTAPGFDPRTVVYLPPEARALVVATNRTRARILAGNCSAHRIGATIEAEQPCVVVIAQAYYHPWQARIDGTPARLWRANHAFQALEIPGGRHVVTLAYRDHAFFAGATIAFVTLLMCGLIWWSGRTDDAKSPNSTRIRAVRKDAGLDQPSDSNGSPTTRHQ